MIVPEDLMLTLVFGVNLILAVALVVLVTAYRKLLADFYKYKQTSKEQAKVDKVLKDLEKRYELEAKIFLKQQREEINEMFETISNYIKNQLVGEVDSLRADLGNLAGKMQQEFSKRLDEEYTKISQEIENYRLRQFGKVDQEIEEIVRNVTKKVLGRSIEPKDHQDLVLKALEEAKKQHVL
jgi:F0F1-type ATP synthase membrane subunit b/b'